MLRKIIVIDNSKCNGCGLCVDACHEGAIGIKDNKAYLLREDYCDGLGDCLPACPTNAISFEVREAAAYNEEAVATAKEEKDKQATPCTAFFDMKKENEENKNSCLNNFPLQIKLVNIKSDIFEGADLLIAADCTAYAYKNFHNDFMSEKTTLIGCTKLDQVDYSGKLSEIFIENNIKSIIIARMQVPCCSGLVVAVKKALEKVNKKIATKVFTISADGRIINEEII